MKNIVKECHEQVVNKFYELDENEKLFESKQEHWNGILGMHLQEKKLN